MATADTARTYNVTVSLTMSKDEAQAVADVLSMVGGDQTDTRRVHTAAVFRALANAGIKGQWRNDMAGWTYFEGPPDTSVRS